MRSNPNNRAYLIAPGSFFLFSGLVWFALNLTQDLFDPNHLPVGKYVLRSGLLILSLVIAWFGVYRTIQIFQNKNSTNILLSITTLFSLVLILEIGLSLAPISSGGGQVLVSRNWFNFYWHENQLEYRDVEPAEMDRPDKSNILIVGDSYVAGHGLKKENERFSNILREKLAPCFDVFNLGICGTNTVDELAFLKNYPVKPDLVILVHGKNDIQDVRPKSEIQHILNMDSELISDYPRRKWQSSFLMKNSFLVNLVEFLVHKIRESQYFDNLSAKHLSFEQILQTEQGKMWYYSYYLNNELFETHLSMLDSIANWSSLNNSEHLLVLFPATTDQILADTERIINQPIQRHSENNKIAVLNLTSIVEALPESDRVVSKLDPHPGIELNSAVADTLFYTILNMMTEGASCKISGDRQAEL